MTVRWQKVDVPLAAGLQNRTSDQALEPPGLEVCKNGEFDELGAIRKRRPFATLLSDPSGNEDIRRIVPFGDELLVFTADKVYSYFELDSEAVEVGEYLAATVEETSRFTSTSEQAACDRAELNGIVVVAWKDEVAAATVKFAAYEKATGSLVLSERTVSGAIYPKLVALQNRILLFYATSALVVLPLDPSSVSDLVASADATPVSVDVAISSVNPAIDCIQDTQTATRALISYRLTTAVMTVKRIDEAGATVDTNATGRTVNDATAIAQAPNGKILAVRNVGTNLEADLLNSDLTDSTASIAVGSGTTAINQIAAAFKSVLDAGQYRCHVFWSSNEQATASTNFECKTNYVDDAGAASTQSVLANRLGVASRAFEYAIAGTSSSRVMVWLAFAAGSSSTAVAQLQNTYLLCDMNGGIHAKAVQSSGGGYSQLTGHLPGVQDLGGGQYAAALIERRVIPLENAESAFAQRSPREVILSLDDDQARRAVQLGRTLYLAGAQVQQYDGRAVHELGFAVFPYNLSVIDAAAGNLADGAYTWRPGIRWENAKGELERATSVTFFDQNMTGGGSRADISTSPVHPTTKTDPQCAYELWRTAVDPVLDSPFYLVTSKDPTATGSNGYLENDPATGNFATYSDDLADADLTTKETHPDTGGVLATTPPPSATIIAADAGRLFLAGLAGRPYRVAYSKLRGEGELAQFNDALVIELPSNTGAVTAISILNDTPIAFCERGCYALVGAGFNNLGGGQNYQPRLLSSDVGAVNADAVAVTPQGVVFLSAKGWHLLDRGMAVRYIGAPVSDFDGYTFTDVAVATDQHHVRCFGYSGSDAVALVLDTVAGQWSEWELGSAIHAAQYRGRYLVTTAVDVSEQVAQHGSGFYTYSLDLETAWIKLDGLQGFRRVRRLLVLGEYRSAHRLRVRIAYDYDDAWVDDFYWTVDPTDVGGPEQVETRPSRPKGQAIKVRLTCRHTSTDTPAAGEALKLTGLALEVGTKRTLYRALPAAQKQ